MLAKAEALLEKKNLRYVKKGIFWGLMAGFLAGWLTIFEDTGLAMEPFVGAEALALLAVPVIFGFMQDFSSCVCTLVPNIVNGKIKEYARALRIKPIALLVISSIIGGPGAVCCYIGGVFFAGPFYPVVLSATFPALGAVLARIVLKEKINARGWIGIIVCVAGACIASIAPTDVSAYPNFTLGIVFGILASVCWAFEGVISCAGMDFIDPEVAIGLRYSISCVFYLVVGLPFISGVGAMAYGIVGEAFISPVFLFVFLAGAVEGIGYYFYYKACNACGSARGETLDITYVIWSCIICAIFYSEPLTIVFWVGTVLVVVGGILIAGKPSELFSLRNVE